jgi:hypothetical protein
MELNLKRTSTSTFHPPPSVLISVSISMPVSPKCSSVYLPNKMAAVEEISSRRSAVIETGNHLQKAD